MNVDNDVNSIEVVVSNILRYLLRRATTRSSLKRCLEDHPIPQRYLARVKVDIDEYTLVSYSTFASYPGQFLKKPKSSEIGYLKKLRGNEKTSSTKSLFGQIRGYGARPIGYMQALSRQVFYKFGIPGRLGFQLGRKPSMKTHRLVGFGTSTWTGGTKRGSYKPFSIIA